MARRRARCPGGWCGTRRPDSRVPGRGGVDGHGPPLLQSPGMIVERELSLRAVLTGALLGVLLTPSNVYAGLKIGWSFNMSVIALLVGFGFWQGLAGRFTRKKSWTL